MNAREEVLARVRRALADVPDGEPPDVPDVDREAYRAAPRTDLCALFAERASEYTATVRHADHGDVAAAVAAACAAHGAVRMAVPPELPSAWVPDGVEAVADRGLLAAELDALDGALTGCAAAIAETGTVVLDGGARSGRRALTLVPDLHVCVVEATQILAGLPEALASVSPRQAITLVSGPSATSDIELVRVEGVHGPRRLELVILTGGD